MACRRRRRRYGTRNGISGDQASSDPLSRRSAIALGAGIVGVAGAGSALLKGWPDDTHTRPGTHARSPGTVADPIPLDEVKRSPTPQRPVAAGTFADRDESFAASGTSSDDHKPKRPEPPPEGRLLSGPAAAAAAATSFDSPFLATDRPEMHLARRATIGPSQGDIAAIEEQGIDRWLTDQLDPARADPEGDAAFALFPLAGKDAAGVAASIERFHWDAMVETGQATLARQMWSRRQLYEVTVDVFANHLNVTMPFDGGWDVGPSYHQDVIRGHAFGRFADMLLAAMKHPAMLRYLNNDESTKQSVNENLGRELLELHTVGIEGGYDEDDVRNSAYILTGRTTDGETGAYRYAADRHYTGPVQVLDFSHANGAPDGDAVADAYLTYLATHPATARSIARKLAVRFVADSPPPSLVDRLQQSYLESGTAIVPVLVTLFSSTEFWEAVGHKTRRPLENLVASLRTVGVTPGPDAGATRKAVENLYWGLQEVGHQPLRWSPPNGYPDVQAAWTSAGALLATWNVHRGVVQGWWEGLGYPEPESMVDDATTSGEYVDALCRRLTGQAFPAAAREALLEFAGAASDEPVGSQPLGGRVPHVAPLVLDSIYFALR